MHPTLRLLAFVLALTASLRAATYTWDGSSNNLNSPHWTPGPVAWPGEGHDMIVNAGTVTVTDSQAVYRPQNFVINGGRLKIAPGGGLFPGSDATSRVITVNAGGVLELDTWFKADGQSLGRLIPDAARIVVNGGTIRVTGVTGYGRGVTVNSAGATLEAALDADWLLNQNTDDTAWIYNGNPTLIFTGAGEGRFEKAISGSGGVIKRGSGKWALTRSSTYTGSTTVEQGILVLRRASLADAATVSIASGAILSLRHVDTDVVGALMLGGIVMPAGTYNRTTHPQYFSGSGSLVVGGAAVTGTPSLSWFYGGGGDAAIQQQITDSMNYAVGMYNSHGYFHGSIRGEYNSGVPTAQANFNGPITFGGSRNGRVAMHEFGHVWGVGTRGEWDANFSNGVWVGPNVSRLIQQIDGPGAGIFPSGVHFYPYGLNYDNESSPRNDIVAVRIVEAMYKDMGFFAGTSTISGFGDRTLAVSASTGALGVTIGDPAVAATALVLHVTSSNPALIPAGGIVLGGSGANRTLNITPTAGMSGVAVITLSVSGGRDAAFTSFILTVGTYNWNGGSGLWDTTSANWNGAATVWPTLGSNNDAVFGATPGVVTVQGSVSADDLAFNTTGYDVTGGTIQFVNTPAIAVAAGATATIGSTLAGTAGLAKDGAGTLVLTGASAYGGGIFVNVGTLLVDGDFSGSASVLARTGATLGGRGRLPATTIEATAQLSPGPGIATLSTEALVFQSGSALTMELGLASDRVAVTGNLTLAGTLNVVATVPLLNGAYTLISYTGTRTGAMALSGIPAGYTMSLDYSLPGQVRLLVSGGIPSSVVIPAGSIWKYNAVGANLGTGWRLLDYNDNVWSTGPAQIGYGEGDEATAISTASGKPQILYFRKAFTLTAAEVANISNLVLRLLRDDGAVVYLNGLEIRRDNLPPAPAWNTPATAQVLDADESEFFVSTVDASLLNAGANLIAVEVHQYDAASSDMSFDLRLEAILGDPDTDDDGLTDTWEMTWFGNLTAQSGTGDADSDGVSNFTEMKARSAPTNRAQTFVISTVSTNVFGQITITWPSVPGVLYQIRRGDLLTPWTTLPGTITGDGSVKTFTDTDPLPPGVTQMFYEVVVP